MFTAVRRASDGLLADIQNSPNLPANPAARVANAVGQFGAADWLVVEIPENVWAGVNPLARQFAVMNGSLVASFSQSMPPAVSFSAGEVAADGVAEITLTVDCGSSTYNGAVMVRIFPPDSDAVVLVLTASGGIASEAINTEIEGTHRVEAETVLHGIGSASFEGI